MANYRLFWAYYIILLVWGLFGIFDAVYGMSFESMGNINPVYSAIGTIVELGIFIFSIIALVMFIKNSFSKITWVLPVFQIVTTLFLFVYGFTWGIIIAMQGISPENAPLPPAMAVIGLTFNLLKTGFSGYIIYRFK